MTRWRPRIRAPEDRVALAFALGWTVIGITTIVGAGVIEINVTSAPIVRLLAVLGLVVIGVLALMIASDDAARAYSGLAGGRIDRVMHWLTTAFVSLTALVVLGVLGMAVAPDTPGAANLGKDLGLDVAIGVVGGALAWGIVALTAVALGRVIWWVQRPITPERAERWRAPRHVPFGRQLLVVARWPLLALGGLLVSVICLAVTTTLTTNHAGAPGVPTVRTDSVLFTVVLPLTAWFAGTAGVWALTRSLPGPQHGPRRHATHAIALGVCLVIVFAYASSGTVESHARGELWGRAATGTGIPRPVSAAGVAPDRLDAYLAAQFAPRLDYADGERWHATSVSWYLSQNHVPNTMPPFCNVQVTGADGRTEVPGCYQLPCDDVQGACTENAPEDPTLYYLVWSGADPPKGDRIPARLGKAWTLIQYWIFYNYDSLQTTVVRQWHEADWEQVSVLLANAGTTVRPLEVAYSEHCYGARLPAKRVIWLGTHPVTWVAKGSHGNYPRPVNVPVRDLRCSLGVTPRYLGVAGLFFSPAVDGPAVEVPVGYLAGLTDSTDGARPGPVPRLVPMRTTAAITSFAGRWARDNNLGVPGFGSSQPGPGPPSPQTQAPAKTPFQSMLCSTPWLAPSAKELPCR